MPHIGSLLLGQPNRGSLRRGGAALRYWSRPPQLAEPGRLVIVRSTTERLPSRAPTLGSTARAFVAMSRGVTRPDIPNVLAARYASLDMATLWSPERKIIFERQLWIAVLEAQRELGVRVPDGVVEAYRARVQTST